MRDRDVDAMHGFDDVPAKRLDVTSSGVHATRRDDKIRIAPRS
jgi:hypothetical protein